MKLIASAKMKAGTFEAKFVPLSQVEMIDEIIIIRKEAGPPIGKIKYILLPKICKIKFINLILTPVFMTYYAKKFNVSLILSYHFIPHAFFAYISSCLTNIPFGISQTGLYIQKYSKYPILSNIIRTVLKKASFINVPGNNSKKFWDKFGIDISKINTIHSTIDTNNYIPENINKTYDFIFTGRLNYIKQLDKLIKAFDILLREFENTSMVIVGNGPELGSLTKLVTELNLTSAITFSGFQTNIKHWLNKSKIFVMTSQSEGLPCAIMEAMACELLVLAPDVGNITDVIKNNETGFIIKNDEILSIYGVMKKGIVDYETNYSIRSKARETIIDKHSYNSAITRWSKLLLQFRR